MRLRPAPIPVAVLALLLGAGGVLAAGRDPAAVANACAACHGPDGRSAGAIPSIAGMPAADFVAAMRAFREGERDATIMGRIAGGFSEAEIETLAAYYAAMR